MKLTHSNRSTRADIKPWKGLKVIRRYKPFILPSEPRTEGGTWSRPRLEMEKVKITYKEYMAAFYNETNTRK